MKYLSKYVLLAASIVLFIGMASATCVRGPDCGGLSPGYYKNHVNDWVGYDSSDTVISVFSTSHVSDSDTLLDALKYKGGNGIEGAERILLRQAVAALLNEANPEIPYYNGWSGNEGPGDYIKLNGNTNKVLKIVEEVLGRANPDRDEMLFWAYEFDYYNNIGV